MLRLHYSRSILDLQFYLQMAASALGVELGFDGKPVLEMDGESFVAGN